MSLIKRVIFCISLATLAGTASADSLTAPSDNFESCVDHPELQIARSIELQAIVDEDQKDRIPPIDWSLVSPRDLQRSIRVAEIFAQGCLATANDYAAAALIFQHGTVSDHYFQAYLWAKKSFELGRKDQSQMIANAVDRYLISIGQRQLFATQSFRNGPNSCRCLGEVEPSFPNQRRIEYTGKSLNQRIEEIKNSNASNSLCKNVVYCSRNLKDADRGIFPGIW